MCVGRDALTHVDEMSEELRLQSLKNLTDLLSHTFTSQFVFPALGHEDVGLNFSQTAILWKHWLPSEALQTFEKCWYFPVQTHIYIHIHSSVFSRLPLYTCFSPHIRHFSFCQRFTYCTHIILFARGVFFIWHNRPRLVPSGPLAVTKFRGSQLFEWQKREILKRKNERIKRPRT